MWSCGCCCGCFGLASPFKLQGAIFCTGGMMLTGAAFLCQLPLPLDPVFGDRSGSSGTCSDAPGAVCHWYGSLNSAVGYLHRVSHWWPNWMRARLWLLLFLLRQLANSNECTVLTVIEALCICSNLAIAGATRDAPASSLATSDSHDGGIPLLRSKQWRHCIYVQ